MKRYSHLFFDLDRTLWDFDANSRETLMEMYHEFSLRVYVPDFFSFYRAFHEVNDQLWLAYRKEEISKQELRWKRFYLTLGNFNCSDIDLAKKLDEVYVKRSPFKTKLFPGTIETLELLDGKFRMFILTNGFAEVQFVKLENCGLQKFFEKVFISEQVGVQKPAKGYFEFVLQDLNVSPSTCLMIGDDCNTDIKGAKSCDIDQVYFNPKKVKSDCVPTFEITNMQDLLQILN